MQVNEVSLGTFITMRRKHLRLTQQLLADKIHVSKSAIAKWETDGGIPDRDNMKRLSETLDVSVDDLYRLADDGAKKIIPNVNITADIITLLESYGYKVIAPNEGENE